MDYQPVINFCRLRLGMKPVIDYAQSRRKLLGITELPIRTILDVGANVGKKTRQFRKLFPEATIYCFEPVLPTYEKLQSWASQQKGMVQAFHLALGDHVGETRIHWNQQHSGGSTLLQPSSQRQSEYVSLPVRMETLDGISSQLDVRDQIFVKIDVEGFDMHVIKGGTNLLERASAVMIEIAISESPTDLPTFPDFMRALSDLGYLYRGNVSHGFVNGIPRLADAVFIRPPATRRAAA